MQALGWRQRGALLLLQDGIFSVAYWCQTLPHAPFPPLPGRDTRAVVWAGAAGRAGGAGGAYQPINWSAPTDQLVRTNRPIGAYQLLG